MNITMFTALSKTGVFGYPGLKNRIVSYRINCEENNEIEPEHFLNTILPTINRLLLHNLNIHTALKVNFELFATYTLPKNDEISMKSFNSRYFPTFQNTNIPEMYTNCCRLLIGKLTEFQLAESGWTLVSTNHLEVNVTKYNPLRAGSYIALPKKK